MNKKSLYLTSKPIGIGHEQFGDDFYYQGDRPARHCRICGTSYQPVLARSPLFDSNQGVQYEVELLLKEWAIKHSRTHNQQEYKHLADTGLFMTPEAALKLIPLGIYPIQDLTTDEEVIQAGFEAKRAPQDDVPDR